MKIIHVTTTDFGGAFKAVERIQASLRYFHEESDILVRSRFFETETIEVINTPLKKLLSKTKNFLNLLFSHGEVITDLLGTDITRHSKVKEADIVVLHWVNSFISYKSVKLLVRLHKPIIWVMHDMWVFTGGCHYDAYCNNFKKQCGYCPYLGKKKKKDISYWNLKKKQELFDSVNIHFVAISRWEMQCALASTPLKEKKITWISNPLNVDIFRPLDRGKLRKKFNIAGKKVILFGADKALENPTKGFKYLVEALNFINGKDYCAICFGKAPEKKKIKPDHIEVQYIGTIRDEETLAEWYNIADIFVAPSLQEGFGYTVCEALACGTPVTAFAVGGMLDQIIHRESGYLAELYDAEDLAKGIQFCADNRNILGERAREWVVAHNSYEIIGKKYCRYFAENFYSCRQKV